MRFSTLAFAASLTAVACTAADFPFEQIHGFGSKTNRVNFLIVGDGWTQADLDAGKFKAAVATLKENLFKNEPYNTYRNYFTITRVDVPSVESGVTHEYVWLGQRVQHPTSSGSAGGSHSTTGLGGILGGLFGNKNKNQNKNLNKNSNGSPAPGEADEAANSNGRGNTNGGSAGGATPSTGASVSATHPATWTAIVDSQPETWIQTSTGKIYLTGRDLDTYFGTWYYAARNDAKEIVSIDRSIFFRGKKDWHKLMDELNKDLPRTVVCCLANDTMYGGAAVPGFFVVGNNASATQVMAHELGHALSRLGDEYVETGNEPKASPPPEPDLQANVTLESDPAKVKWKPWIDAQTPGIGVYEGALLRSKGVYRSKERCQMRSCSDPLCEICLEESLRRLFTTVSVIDSATPDKRSMILLLGKSQTFKVNAVGPQQNQIEGEWFLDGKSVKGTKADTAQGPVFELTLGPDQLVVGNHTVRFLGTDKTQLIKDPKAGDAAYTRAPNERNWYVKVGAFWQIPGLWVGSLFE